MKAEHEPELFQLAWACFALEAWTRLLLRQIHEIRLVHPGLSSCPASLHV